MQGRLHFPRPCSELDKLPERRLEFRLPRTSFMSLMTINVGRSPFTKTRLLRCPLWPAKAVQDHTLLCIRTERIEGVASTDSRRFLRASERPPLSRAKPERAGPNLAIKKVHHFYSPKPVRSGRRAWQDSRDHDMAPKAFSSKQAKLRRKAGVQEVVSTVLRYVATCMCACMR
jgi:hypothetical protein